MYLGNPGLSQTSSQSGACFPSGQVYHYPTNSQATFCMSNQFTESSTTPHLQPSSQLPLASPPLLPLHPTVTNVNSPMVAGGDCSMMVSPSSITTATTEQWPFKLHFVVRNISRCAGCTGRYNKPSLPPDNLCVQHKEWGQINFPNLPSPSTRFSNAYYHLNLRCICSNWPHFIPSDLVILPSMCAALQPEHRDILRDLGFQPWVCFHLLWLPVSSWYHLLFAVAIHQHTWHIMLHYLCVRNSNSTKCVCKQHVALFPGHITLCSKALHGNEIEAIACTQVLWTCPEPWNIVYFKDSQLQLWCHHA